MGRAAPRRAARALEAVAEPHLVAAALEQHGPRQVLELVVGGELANYVMSAQTWNEAEAGRCMHQVLSGMAYLHSQGVCHRDIKPQNLLVHPETHMLKLCDFGSAKILVKGEPNVSYICSRYYRAPELLLRCGTTKSMRHAQNVKI